MVSLVDIGPSRAEVPIREVNVTVNGLTAEHIFEVFMQFPEIRRLLTQDNVGQEVVSSLISRFPEAAGLILAAGTGVDLGNEDAREKACAAARSLTLGEQFEIFEKILELTFPRGVQNFLDAIQQLLKGVGRGWAQATTSPAPSNVVSLPEGANETAGEARLAS